MSNKAPISVSTSIVHLIGPGTLKVINGQLAFTTGHGTPMRLNPKALHSIYCFGPVGISDKAVILLLKHKIYVAFLTFNGKVFRGCLHHLRDDSTLLRICQYQTLSNPQIKLEIAMDSVVEKIESQISAARHYQRQGISFAGDVLRRLKRSLKNIQNVNHISSLRGCEGDASAAWFELFGKTVVSPWMFTKRVRRPPTDPVNALLSLGYTLLVARTAAICEAAGLEVNMGALHDYRPGRPSLACDLMEPFRIPAVDRWVIKLCNQGHLSIHDFQSQNGGVFLKKEIYAATIANWEEFWYKENCYQAMLDGVRKFCSKIRTYSH